MTDRERPYRRLGAVVKNWRKRVFESLPETSGALEIDIETLARIEQGAIRPTEETLLLLATHFGVKDNEVNKLWEMAGYPSGKLPEPGILDDEIADTRQMVVMVNDLRIVYTDGMHIAANNHGLVMNFMQSGGPGNQPLAVARVGMSREHAKSMLKLLERTLNQKAMPAIHQLAPHLQTQNSDPGSLPTPPPVPPVPAEPEEPVGPTDPEPPAETVPPPADAPPAMPPTDPVI